MDIEKLRKIKETFDAKMSAFNDATFLDELLKKRALVGSTIIEGILIGFETYSNSFGISLYYKLVTGAINKIIAEFDSSIIPYLNEAYLSQIKAGLANIETYYIELQNYLVNIVILGNPLKSKILQPPTQIQVKMTENFIEESYIKSKELAEKLENLDKDLNVKKTELEKYIDSKESKFNTTVTSQLNNLSSQIDTIRLTIENVKNDFIQEKDRIIQKSTTDLESQYSKAEAIVDLISKSSQASAYGETAEKYKKAKNIWQFASVAFLIFTVIVGMLSMIPNNLIPLPSDYVQFSIRILVALSLGSASAYSARLAHKNFKLEVRTRLIYLDLLTIDSFIKNAKDPDTLKASLASKYFGKFDEINDPYEDGLFLNPNQIKELLNLIKEIKK